MLWPQTYMNEAGRSVGPARGSFKLPLERVLVVHDEIDLPFGDVRTRLGGGLAGHNGLKSIKRELGGADFMRVRVGVGRPKSTDPEIVSAYVLGRFREPADEVGDLIDQACQAVERVVLGDGVVMSLRSLLGALDQDAAATRLAREGGHAFVSSSLRPYVDRRTRGPGRHAPNARGGRRRPCRP